MPVGESRVCASCSERIYVIDGSWSHYRPVPLPFHLAAPEARRLVPCEPTVHPCHSCGQMMYGYADQSCSGESRVFVDDYAEVE
jgi:hypothetical protein